MKFTLWMPSDDGAGEPISLAKIERHGPVVAASLGLKLAESKALLSAAQRALVQAQFREYLIGQRTCAMCGSRRRVKDYHEVIFKRLFGGDPLRLPRLLGCGCDGETVCARTVKLDGRNTWVAPELGYVQSHLAATMAYARAKRLLEMFLPISAGNSVSSVRRRTFAVGERLDTELHQAEDDRSAGTTRVVAMGLDSGYVLHCRPGSERWFEVVVGRTLAHDSSFRSVGFVRTVEDNDRVRHRIKRRVAELVPMTWAAVALTPEIGVDAVHASTTNDRNQARHSRVATFEQEADEMSEQQRRLSARLRETLSSGRAHFDFGRRIGRQPAD